MKIRSLLSHVGSFPTLSVCGLVVLLLCVPRVSMAQSASQGAVAVEPPVLSAGDVVHIEVWRQPELSGDFTIAADGTIRHPLYRDVHVGSLSLPAAEERVRDFLRQYQTEPQFIMAALLPVSVGGEVNKPDLLSLPPETTVAEALARAGGPTEDGRLDRVRLLRGGEELTLNLSSPEEPLARMLIRSGDQIVVDRRRSLWREVIGPAVGVTGAAASLLIAITRISN